MSVDKYSPYVEYCANASSLKRSVLDEDHKVSMELDGMGEWVAEGDYENLDNEKSDLESELNSARTFMQECKAIFESIEYDASPPHGSSVMIQTDYLEEIRSKLLNWQDF